MRTEDGDGKREEMVEKDENSRTTIGVVQFVFHHALPERFLFGLFDFHLLVFIIFVCRLGLETGFGEGLCRSVVDFFAASASARDGGWVYFREILGDEDGKKW